MKPIKRLFAAFYLISLVFITLRLSAGEDKPGKDMGKRIGERVEAQETTSTDQESLVKEIADYARKVGEEYPDDPDAVKKAVNDKLDEIRDRETSGQGKNRKPGGKDNKEVKAWIKKLKKELMDGGHVMLPGLKDAGVVAIATGTGRTTGHIADLSLKNNSDKAKYLDIGPFFIPSDGKYQPYMVPRAISISVPPGASVTVPLDGICADIHLPPVPDGEPILTAENWISASKLPDNWKPDTSHGWQNHPGSNLTIPGTGQPMPYKIDINKYPEEAAPVLFEMADRITDAYDKLKEEGAISTPFSQNPEKERESVIQQTFWILAASLTGTAYKLEDFNKKTEEQFVKSTGKTVKNLPKEEKKQLENGVNTFWNTFQAVGVEAKLLSASSMKK